MPFRIDPDGLSSIADVISVMELRLAVEIEAAALAAERASAQHLRGIERALADIDRAIRKATRQSRRISRFIARSPKPPPIRTMPSFSDFSAAMSFRARACAQRVTIGDEQTAYLKKIQIEHRQIASAIRARDRAAARRAMRTHLGNSLMRYRRLAKQVADRRLGRRVIATAILRRPSMKRVLMTGAAGGVGTMLLPLLRGIYPELRLSDISKPQALAAGDKFVAADLTNIDEVEKICDGVDGILHFGGYSIEGSWDQIRTANIEGCYNLFEAARAKGVKRIVFASSNHAVGFYPRTTHIGTERHPAARQPLRRLQGVRRGARRVLCGQARTWRHVAPDRQRRSGSRSTSAGSRSGCIRKTCCSSAASASSIPASAMRCSTAPR